MCRYPSSTIYRYLDLPSTQIFRTNNSHGHIITTPLRTLVKTPNPLPTYTTATLTNVQQCPCSHMIGNPNPIHSLPSPPTPLRAKHIHISHTPLTPLIPRTRLSHNTSVALDTIPEPRIPTTCPAFTTTTPPPSPTPVFPSPSQTLTLSQHTHK